MTAVEIRHMCDWSNDLDELENVDEQKMMLSNAKHLRVTTAAAPGEDVWLRLDLPPTPPRSPTKSIGEPTQNDPTVAERLQLVSESLDGFLEVTERGLQPEACSLGSKLIQDCMWNGKVSEREKGSSCIDIIYDTPCATPPQLDYTSTECVDPSAVFPYPLNETGPCQQEETDEEIDVVSLDKPELKRKTSEPIIKENKVQKLLKRTKSLPVKSSGRSAKRTYDDSSSDSSTTTSYEHSRNNEDSDSDKRASHNVLERKRRNDLKSSFHTLRSYIPPLSGNEKAAKVVILKKATDYIHELRKNEDDLAKEKEELKIRQRELLERFIKLKPKAK